MDNMSAEKAAARAWLERCAPEYRAILDQALSDELEPAGGFLDSWQETRKQTKAAVDAFTQAQQGLKEADARIGRPLHEVARELGWTEEELDASINTLHAMNHPEEWVDPCPTWDELRAMLPFRLNPGTPKDGRMRARYEAGRKQYREDWTQYSVQHLTDMIAEEDDDAAIYRAMRKHVMRERGLL